MKIVWTRENQIVHVQLFQGNRCGLCTTLRFNKIQSIETHKFIAFDMNCEIKLFTGPSVVEESSSFSHDQYNDSNRLHFNSIHHFYFALESILDLTSLLCYVMPTALLCVSSFPFIRSQLSSYSTLLERLFIIFCNHICHILIGKLHCVMRIGFLLRKNV